MVEFDGLERVPEVGGVADIVHANFIFIEVERRKEIIIAALHGFKFLSSAFMALSEGENAGDFCLMIHECTVELSPDVGFLLVLFCVTNELHMANGVDANTLQLEL